MAVTLTSLEEGSLRFVLETAPMMLREGDAERVGEVLIERIRAEKDTDQGVNQLLRMMSLHLHSNPFITEQLIELLYFSPYRTVIIHHLPNVIVHIDLCIRQVIRLMHFVMTIANLSIKALYCIGSESL